MTNNNWDLIVVGAGSAGAALAVRSAEKGQRVLLLEAGRDYRSDEMHEAWRSPNPVVALTDPTAAEGMVWTGLDSTRTDKQQMMPYWRGKGTGGSSSINGQIAIRPPVEDFDDWAKQGCTGWSAEDVLPYFKKLEDDEDFGDETYHGRGGPTPIYRARQDQWGVVDSVLATAALTAGYKWADDVNAPKATGISPYPISSRDSRRVCVNDAYLESARDLPNLTIRGEALVDRVVFEGNRAVGVRVVVAGEPLIEHAGTVVLSAGVIHSPAILMRSGIGPAQHLRSVGIDVRADLPVGLGMQDHPMAMISLPLTEDASIKSPHDRHTNVCVRWTSDPTSVRWTSDPTSPVESPESDLNDLMFVSMNQSVLAMATADTGAGYGALGVWLNQNYSRGRLSLESADPEVQPLVRQQMLSDPRDLPRMRHGIRALVELARSEAADAIIDGSIERENQQLFAALDNDDELDEYLLATVGDAQHGTSTCRMGTPGDDGVVVDPLCRVTGFEGLRVVDASIFPSVPRANTNLATIMLGELMADRLD